MCMQISAKIILTHSQGNVPRCPTRFLKRPIPFGWTPYQTILLARINPRSQASRSYGAKTTLENEKPLGRPTLGRPGRQSIRPRAVNTGEFAVHWVYITMHASSPTVQHCTGLQIFFWKWEKRRFDTNGQSVPSQRVPFNASRDIFLGFPKAD